MNLKEIRSTIERKKGQKEEIDSNIFKLKESSLYLTKEIRHSEKAQAIIQNVAKKTQAQLEFHISDIVSMALDTIFDNPYKFKIEFVLKRNKTECELLFEKDREKINPLSASGGGVVDIASFALRIALWTLQRPQSRNTIILDESFKFVSKDLLPRVGLLLRKLSQKLNLQIILVTHLSELIEEADKVFQVSTDKKGISKINNGER